MKTVDIDLFTKLIMALPEIPDQELEDVKITSQTIKAGEDITVVSMRNAMFMGWQPTKTKFSNDYTVKKLEQADRGTWMSTLPAEVWQMHEPLLRARGNKRILVGGLGLGIATHLFAEIIQPQKMVTIELNHKIRAMVEPHISKKNSTVTTASIFDYIKLLKPNSYDFAFLDTWQSTGEIEWSESIVPLRRLARNKIKTVMCWNEEEMKGQLRQGLPRNVMWKDDYNYGGIGGYSTVFRNVARKKGIAPLVTAKDVKDDMSKMWEAEAAMRANEGLIRLLELYLRPGTNVWEKTFGEEWDEVYSKTISEED